MAEARSEGRWTHWSAKAGAPLLREPVRRKNPRILAMARYIKPRGSARGILGDKLFGHKMHYFNAYSLAATVKTRLTAEAVKGNCSLHRLVCQANLLDSLIDSLNTDSNSVTFESLATPEYSDSESSDSSEGEEDDVEDDDEYRYETEVVQTYPLYHENVSEVLSSDDEDADADDDGYVEMLGLERMHSNSSSFLLASDDYYYQCHTLSDDEIEDEELPSISNCSSLSSLDECELDAASTVVHSRPHDAPAPKSAPKMGLLPLSMRPLALVDAL